MRQRKTPQDLAAMAVLGNNITRLREHHGLTKDMLARLIGVSPTAIGGYEQGRNFPTAAHLVQLVHVLNTNWGTLFYGVEDAR